VQNMFWRYCAGAALGIAVKRPQRVPGLCAGKARTCNGKPGPQVTPKL